MYNLEIEDNHNFMLANTIITCNSLLLHRIKDEIFWLWREIGIIMNDVQEEYLDWSKKQENEEWINQLLVIDEKPTPLPMVYVYPHTDELKLDYVKLQREKKFEYLQITVPFSEVIEHAEIYLRLKDTTRYILDIKNELLGCETGEEVRNLIEENFPNKTQESMKNKMLVSFGKIFNEEILNITNKEYPYKLSFGEFKENPFVILAKYGIDSCFETNDLFSKRYMPEVFAHHLNCIFKSKSSGGILEGRMVHIFFDEITQICSDEDKNSAYKSLCTIATRGRKHLIGLIYATQNYSKIPRKIKSNTDYVFAFQHSNEEEVNLIKKDFDLINLDKKEILNLEDFEVMGITNEYFICYKNGRKWEDKGPIKGRLIPPMSNHRPPS